MTRRVQILKDKFSQSLGLPFQELLPSSVIGQALKELKIRYKQRLFDPMVTLWAFYLRSWIPIKLVIMP
ncbi:MAG: hypothetical protein CLLPBCKN_006902 [Chroococcidiopsis cubana SAG 39.79]|nr:hypothetical protein [Chroococcidiopsis cubana SAG 39.79]